MSARLLLMLAALAGLASCIRLRSSRQASRQGQEPTVQRPVGDVVTLLKDLLATVKAEAEEKGDAHEKFMCQCEKGDASGVQGIEEAQNRINSLESSTEQLTARKATLQTEIERLAEEVRRNNESRTTAVALRAKALETFTEEEKELTESITALRAAVEVLKKHHENFLQLPPVSASQVAAAVRRVLSSHGVDGVLTKSQRQKLASFVEGTQPAHQSEYVSQSGEVFGILKQMLDEFQSNLVAARKEEAAAVESHEGLMKAKDDEIASGQTQILSKTEEQADVSQKLEQQKKDLQDTRDQLPLDQQALIDLRNNCQDSDKERSAVLKDLQEEQVALAEAIRILDAGAARDTFHRTFNPSNATSLLQLASVSVGGAKRASKLLRAAAAKLGSSRLANLARVAAAGAAGRFDDVIKAIDDMRHQLEVEKDEESKHKQWCETEISNNELDQITKGNAKTDAENENTRLLGEVQALKDDIARLEGDKEQTQGTLKRESEERELENHDFQKTVADQRAAQHLIQQAIMVLTTFYDNSPGGRAEGSTIIAQLTSVKRDATRLEETAITNENAEQTRYEGRVQTLNAQIDALNTNIQDQTHAKALKEREQVSAEERLERAKTEVVQLSNLKTDLHRSCDFYLDNWAKRTQARDDELAALSTAKAILNGANPNSSDGEIPADGSEIPADGSEIPADSNLLNIKRKDRGGA